MTLKGRHAVVTGGTRGIGLAIASRLHAQGARVSVVSRSPAAGGMESMYCARADVADDAAVARALRACTAVNGAIEILVNNAGVVESATLARTDRAMWDRIVATNLTGAFLCTREVLAGMLAAKWGRIVNVASTAGLGGAPYISAYCASKHGVVGFTRALAAECDGSGVSVNAVCPGYTDTGILHRAVANITARTGRDAAATRDLLARGNPQGRIATAEDVAQGVIELIEGSRTGVALVIPGGRIIEPPSL